MSFHVLSADDTPDESNVIVTQKLDFLVLSTDCQPSCSTSSPGGNLVDGLPPAAHRCGVANFEARVLVRILSDLNESLHAQIFRYE